MPGAYTTVFFTAFDLDDRGQAVSAFSPQTAPSEADAIATATRLTEWHAGAVVWKRGGSPVVGEEGDPIVVWQRGVVGDYD